MKNRKLKFGMIAGLLLLSSITFGGTNGYGTKNDIQYLDVKIIPNEKNIVYVNFDKVQGKTVSIRIFDQDGELLHTEEIEKNSAIIRKYNLPNISKGVYSFEVIDTQMMNEKLHRK